MLAEHIGEISDGFFVEVGAFDGIQWSPSRPLALAGWAGIFFEPQTSMWNALNRNYQSRPDIVCVRKAISNFSGETVLHLGGSVSTIKETTRDLYMTIPEFQSTGLGSGDTEVVSVATLDDELDRLSAPIGFEVLVIDVEGSEEDVLDGFSIEKWRPRLVAIETHENFRNKDLSSKAAPINEYMRLAGYERIYTDHINTVYVL